VLLLVLLAVVTPSGSLAFVAAPPAPPRGMRCASSSSSTSTSTSRPSTYRIQAGWPLRCELCGDGGSGGTRNHNREGEQQQQQQQQQQAQEAEGSGRGPLFGPLGEAEEQGDDGSSSGSSSSSSKDSQAVPPNPLSGGKNPAASAMINFIKVGKRGG
jgi:hypothetical protein